MKELSASNRKTASPGEKTLMYANRKTRLICNEFCFSRILERGQMPMAPITRVRKKMARKSQG